ncbi:MAG: 4Fe-4S dicluster domain-containing protein [Chloroflexi bacterium]|nr:4Fe-4S dicluster domain-containing protein [Chloroflexota bacterium]
MELDRRKFLQISGLALLVLAAKPIFQVVSKSDLVRAVDGNINSKKRLAMAIDLKGCAGREGCTDCVAACHSVHNVPDIGNRKEEIKWIWNSSYAQAFGEKENLFVKEALRGSPVLLLCNHCENPPCVRVCPTQATFKREDGIVMMDYHRCIGCRYCMAACPFGARSFNFRDPRPYIKTVDPDYPTRTKGVVEKCNFCEERLIAGKQPACVEACKNGSIVFGEMTPGTELYKVVSTNYAIRRKVELGTQPQVYYII